jgi:hypothetical protein
MLPLATCMIAAHQLFLPSSDRLKKHCFASHDLYSNTRRCFRTCSACLKDAKGWSKEKLTSTHSCYMAILPKTSSNS